MSKFQVGDRATPITTDSHPHISKGCSYTILSVDRVFVEITDDIGVTNWWNNGWFTKIEGVKWDTAESLQQSYKALEVSLVTLQQQVDQIEAEKVKIVGQLKEMGFALIRGTLVKEQEVVFHKKFEDYSDPFKWKEGYTIKCINEAGWHGDFVSGGIYKVKHADRICGVIVLDEHNVEQEISIFIRDFEFYAPF